MKTRFVCTLAAAAVAGYLAGRKPDEKMPWGYGKCEAVGTLWVAVMLLVAAASLIYHLYEHFKVSRELLQKVVLSCAWSPNAQLVLLNQSEIRNAYFESTRFMSGPVRCSVVLPCTWYFSQQCFTNPGHHSPMDIRMSHSLALRGLHVAREFFNERLMPD